MEGQDHGIDVTEVTGASGKDLDNQWMKSKVGKGIFVFGSQPSRNKQDQHPTNGPCTISNVQLSRSSTASIKVNNDDNKNNNGLVFNITMSRERKRALPWIEEGEITESSTSSSSDNEDRMDEGSDMDKTKTAMDIPDEVEAYDQSEITLIEIGKKQQRDVNLNQSISSTHANADCSLPNIDFEGLDNPILQDVYYGNGQQDLSASSQSQLSTATGEQSNMNPILDGSVTASWPTDTVDDEIVEEELNQITGSIIAGSVRELPSPILGEPMDRMGRGREDNKPAADRGFTSLIPDERPERYSPLYPPGRPGPSRAVKPFPSSQNFGMVSLKYDEEVLLVPGVEECTVGNMEISVDCMKSYCGPSQRFRMIMSLQLALQRAKPGCRIFLGFGEHPIDDLGALAQWGGEIIGPISEGGGQAVISPCTNDALWLNILGSSNVKIQNVTILLNRVRRSLTKPGKEKNFGPDVGIFVQGKLHLNNVIITTKLNDTADNPPRAITGIELSENSSLCLHQSTIKYCSVGLISHTDAETEISMSTISDCVIGYQSTVGAKNYIQDIAILNSTNYAFMVDSETQFGEHPAEDLNKEESFWIDNILVKDSPVQVYFVGMQHSNSSSSTSSAGSGDGEEEDSNDSMHKGRISDMD